MIIYYFNGKAEKPRQSTHTRTQFYVNDAVLNKIPCAIQFWNSIYVCVCVYIYIHIYISVCTTMNYED